MAESYQEYDEDLPVTREANFAQGEYLPAEPVKESRTFDDEDAKDADVLDYTQEIRRAILANVADGKGGIKDDKDAMAIAIATVRDMDNQALKKRGQRQKEAAERANGNVAQQVLEITKQLIERGVSIKPAVTASQLSVPRDLDGDSLPKPTRVMNGEFDDHRAETSAEFFARMENRS